MSDVYTLTHAVCAQLHARDLMSSVETRGADDATMFCEKVGISLLRNATTGEIYIDAYTPARAGTIVYDARVDTLAAAAFHIAIVLHQYNDITLDMVDVFARVREMDLV